MPLPQTAGFFILHINLIGAAAAGKPADQTTYKMIAYIPGYDGTLTSLNSLPYREKIVSQLHTANPLFEPRLTEALDWESSLRDEM